MPQKTLLATLLLVLAVALPQAAHAARRPGSGPAPSIVNPEGIGFVPWQAGLIRVDQNGDVSFPLAVFCGATVRDATHVITAAHCVPDSNASELIVVVGLNDREAPQASGTQAIPVAAITSHPAYGDAGGKANDLAVLTLKQPISHPDVVALPPVPVGANVVGISAMISGWGDIDPATPGGQQPGPLVYAFVNVYPDGQCAGYGGGFDPVTMLCAGYTDGNVTRDTCQGDSGGPLAAIDPDSGEPLALIGVVSFGRGCADPAFPGVYARLTNPDLNARAWAPNPPPRLEPTAAPAVTGALQTGQTVQCAGDAWTDPAPQRTVTWLSAAVDAAGRPTDVRAEGTGPSLAIGAALAGRVLTCSVRATNAGGARELSARVVGPIAVGPPPPEQRPPGTDGPPRDIVAPTAAITKRRCAKRRCTLTIAGSDPGGAVVRATVARQRISGCRKGRRGKKCRAVRTSRAGRIAPNVFQLTTPRLPRARYRFTVKVADRAGNVSRAVRMVLNVRR
jgi:hypothetical protein